MAKVIVGLSGGVDSAVAAYLLKQEGYDVIGVTLRTWESSSGEENRCCEIDDARDVCRKLEIPYHTWNCLSEFENRVTKPFIDAYINGLTPNPCTVCNRYVKWEKMLYIAGIMGADHIATGHYASVVRLDNGRYTVQKAVHSEKDQTYMLYQLTQEQLAATLMPLGAFSKEEVRNIAAQAGIPVAAKRDSQEICFVPDGDYAEYILKNADTDIPGEGPFVDEDGNVLGTHRGIIHYTVGQRKGLGLPLGYPAYVKKIDTARNEVVIARDDALYSDEILCRDLNFLSIPSVSEGEKLRSLVKIRYQHSGQWAWITSPEPDLVKIHFDRPVRAAAPGQSAVFYDEAGCVIGGGTICAGT